MGSKDYASTPICAQCLELAISLVVYDGCCHAEQEVEKGGQLALHGVVNANPVNPRDVCSNEAGRGNSRGC